MLGLRSSPDFLVLACCLKHGLRFSPKVNYLTLLSVQPSISNLMKSSSMISLQHHFSTREGDILQCYILQLQQLKLNLYCKSVSFFFFILRCAFSPCNYTKIIKRILLYIFIQKKKKRKLRLLLQQAKKNQHKKAASKNAGEISGLFCLFLFLLYSKSYSKKPRIRCFSYRG